MNKLNSINFPCVMLEKVEGEIFSEKHLTKFVLVHSQKEIDEKAKFFNHPVLCHYYNVVNEAIRISNLF